MSFFFLLIELWHCDVVAAVVAVVAPVVTVVAVVADIVVG